MAKQKSAERLTLSVAEAARECGVSERKLREMIAGGASGFPVVRFGRRVVVPRLQLEEWLRDRAAVA